MDLSFQQLNKPVRHLLLVDDEESILRSLQRMLRRDGYVIHLATSGEEGLAILDREPIGVIITDQRMPVMTGSQFLSKVKETHPDTIRIVLSGYTELNSITEGINRGAIYKFLTKPWDDELLRTQIADAFAHYELKSENARVSTLNRAIIDAIPDALLLVDADKRAVSAANAAAGKLLGYASTALAGKPIGEIEALPLDHSYWDEISAGGFRALRGVETEYFRADGSLVPVRKSTANAADGQCQYVLVLAHDLRHERTIERLTELNRKLEEAQNQLLQSEKMASVGQLAAGVAHEINNPVGFVNSNLGSLKDQVKGLLQVLDAYAAADQIIAGHPAVMAAIAKAKDSADLEYVRDDIGTLIDESLDGVQRVRRIVQDLKDFSRVDTAEWQFAKLEEGLESTLNIVWNEIKYKAEVHREYAGVPEIECIAAQINQILLNLLVNAAHAIEGRGTITLRTGFDAREVWIEVEDSGKGIPAANLKRIFEPFFTTKPVGQGTGLGLSLAYGIAKRHGGRIEASSEVGVGSKFRRVLPTTRPAADALAAPAAQ